MSRFPRPLHIVWLLLPVTGAILAQDLWMPRLTELVRATTSFSVDVPAPEVAAMAQPVQSSYLGDDFVLRLDGTIKRFGGQSVFTAPSVGTWSYHMARVQNDPIIEINGEVAASGYRRRGFEDWAAMSSSASFATAAQRTATRSFTAEPAPLSPNAIITTGTGTWINSSAGSHNWGDTANWQNGNIPDGTGGVIADFSALDFDTAVTVNLEVSRTVGSMYLGDSADFDGHGHYTVTGATGAQLVFQDPNFNSVLQQVATSGGDTIAVPIVAKNTLTIQNYSPNDFTVSGGISSIGDNLVEFSGYQTTRVTGPITNGGPGNSLRVGVVGSSTVIFTGTNTYTGFTTINGATLLVNGDNSAATGAVSVVNSGSLLGGTGTIGGDVTIGSRGTITGGTGTTVGTLTLSSNLILNGTGEGGSPAYLVNLSGATSDKLVIGGTLSLPGFTQLIFNGTADGTTTYVLATFTSNVNNGTFDFVQNMPMDYLLVYNPTDIELVPVPEPATWIGAALGAGVLLVRRAKKSRK